MESQKSSPQKNTISSQSLKYNAQNRQQYQREEDQDPGPRDYNFYPQQNWNQGQIPKQKQKYQDFNQFNALNAGPQKNKFSQKELPQEIPDLHLYQDYPVKLERVSQQKAEVRKVAKLEIDIGDDQDFENEHQSYEEEEDLEGDYQGEDLYQEEQFREGSDLDPNQHQPEFVEDNSDDTSNERNYDQENFQTDQDCYGQEQQSEQDQEEADQSEPQYEDQESEEGNIPGSSISPSPDEYQNQQQVSNNNYQQYEEMKHSQIYNDQDDGESIRSSNLKSRTSPKKQEEDEDDNNQKKVIMERNDRFIIFKMVPQANKTVDQTSPSAPTLGSLTQDKMQKLIHNTHAADCDSYFLPQDDQNQDPKLEDSEEDVGTSSEDGGSNKQIKQLRSQDQLHIYQKGSTKQTAGTKESKEEVKLNPIRMSSQNNDTDEHYENEDVESILDNSQLKRSIMQYHKSQSDKFSTGSVGMNSKMVAQNLLEQVKKQSNQSNNESQAVTGGQYVSYNSQSPGDIEAQTKDISDLMLFERRSADPMTGKQNLPHHVQPSQLDQMVKAIEREEQKIKSKKPSDPETELLKQEYLKLRQTFNKIQKTTTQMPLQQQVPPKQEPPQYGGQLVLQQAKILNQKELKVVKYENQPLTYNNSRQRGFTNYEESNNSEDYLASGDEEPSNYYKKKRKQSYSPNRDQRKQKSARPPTGGNPDSTKNRDGKKLKAWKKSEIEAQKQYQPKTEGYKKQRKQTSPQREQREKASRQYSKQNYVSNKNKKTQQSQNYYKGKAKSRQEVEKFSESSEEERYRKYKQSKHSSSDSQPKQRLRGKKKSMQYIKRKISSSEEESEEGDSDVKYYSEEEEEVISYKNNKRKKTREYDSESEDYEEEQEESDESDNSSARRRRKKNKNQSKRDPRKSKKGKKFKININMNGGQYTRPNKQETGISNEEYLNQQRQILQQQQLIMAMQQYPSGQAQQMILQPQILQPLHPLIFQQQQTQQQQQQQVFAQQEQQQKNVNFFGNSNSSQQPPMHPRTPKEAEDTKIQQRTHLTRNLSGNQLSIPQLQQQQQSSQGGGSPKKTFLQMNTTKMQTVRQQMRSPKEMIPNIPKANQPNTAPNTSQTQQQQNYLNRLKNRFLQGGNEEDEEFQQEYISRNPDIKQTNSSPGRNDLANKLGNKEANQYYVQRERSMDRFRDYYPENKFHNRTNSVNQNSIPDRFKFQGEGRTFSRQIEQQNNYSNIYPKAQEEEEPVRQSYKQAAKQKAKNSSQDSEGEMSVDEGVKVGNPHIQPLQSPNQSSAFKGNPGARESNIRPSLNKGASQRISVSIKEMKQEQDKKPQAIIIGFEQKNTKDPFANKPTLKSRQAQGQSKPGGISQREKSVGLANNRSKSTTKGIFDRVIDIFSPKKQNEKEAAKTNITSQAKFGGKMDKQLRSPINSNRKIDPPFQKQVTPTKTINIEKKPSHKKEERKTLTKDNQKSRFSKGTPKDDNDLDPSHNKGVILEIFDKKPANKREKVSLADMFRAKKKQAQERDQSKKAETFDQDGMGQDEPATQQPIKQEKKERTKEEILEMRKQMMKSKVKRKEDNFGVQKGAVEEEGKKGGKKDPPMELMHRLAMGQKPKVDAKEMKQRTVKNYENLPEIKKKKEEEKKQADLAARKAATKQYLKQLEEKRKQMILKKAKSAVEEKE